MASNDWGKIVEEKVKDVRKRGYKKRGWVVLRKSWLTSSINYRMDLSEIAVFSKLIVMADEFGPVPGLISDNDCRPMPDEYLAHQACCPLEIFKSVIAKGVDDESIFVNSHGTFLTHFDDYQFTEYDRQRPYREAKRKKEQALEEKLDQAFHQEMGIRYQGQKKELGRSLTGEEEQALTEEVGKEIYGEEDKGDKE